MLTMSARDLTAKYGGSIAQATSRAVRAELTGGNEVLDGLDRLHKLAHASRNPNVSEALDILRSVGDAMRSEIRRRYQVGESEVN